MKNKAQKLIIIAFIFALIATFLLVIYLNTLKSPKAVTKKSLVLVAAETIPPRTQINKKMVKEVQVTDSTLFNDCITDYSQIIGKYSKETILNDEGFRKDKLLSESGDELSLKLDPDYRAISINVSQDAGVSDLLRPNDFVDIVAYFSEKKDGAVVIRPDLAKIVLQNIEVIAVDKQTNRDEKAKEDVKTANNFLITLAVKTSDLEKLVLSESVGSIKLALRPLKSDSIINTKGVNANDLVVDNNSNGNSDPVSSQGVGDKATNSSGYNMYTVKHGDTLKSISRNFYGTPDKYTSIKEANNINDKNIIITGEVIKIPVLN